MKDDFEMAVNMVEYSVATSFKLTENVASNRATKSNSNKVEAKKVQIPEPEHFTLEYAKNNHTFVSYIIKDPTIKIGAITGAKKYPCIKDNNGVVASGRPVAMKFLKGLSHIGLGDITPNEKHFKRKSLINCADEEEKENLRKKFKMFDADFDDVENSH